MIFYIYNEVHLVRSFSNFLFKKRVNLWDPTLWNDGETFYVKDEPRLYFAPQCYVQRYIAVCNALKHEQQNHKPIRKVVDLGCAELGLFTYLKAVDGIEEYIGVDIDLDLLERCGCKLEPQIYDWLPGVRKNPLTASVFNGSATEYDDCLESTDAVICVELIEHLFPEVLEKLPANVFGRIRPHLAIFTTPNCEFNVLFSDFSGMRHPDHKFEWTRLEFEKWAANIVSDFPKYSVKLYGICPPPVGREEVGCCSQMAVFRREVNASPKEPPEITEPYKLIQKFEYPIRKDERTDSEKVISEVRYRFHRLAVSYLEDNYWDDDDGELKAPLEHFLPFVSNMCPTLEKLRETLETDGWIIIDSKQGPLLSLPEEDDESTISGVNDSVIINHDEGDLWETDENEVPRQPNGHVNGTKCEESGSDKLFSRSPEQFSFVEPTKGCHERSWDLLGNDDDLDEKKSLPMSFIRHELSTVPSDKCWSEVTDVEDTRYESDGSEGALADTSWDRPHSMQKRVSSRLAKSFSLDSCLENINCERAEVQVMYLSMHSRTRTLESGSPSERGPDSGYPISFSLDLSEQADLASDDSLSEVEDVPLRPPRLVNPAPQVENGDVANNNRDGEGNNVEGVMNPLPPPFLQEEFPPWLLQLLVDPPPPFVQRDEGLGDDSGSELSDSPVSFD